VFNLVYPGETKALQDSTDLCHSDFMPELSVKHSGNKSDTMLVIKNMAKVVLLDNNSMHRAFSETLAAVNTAILNEPGFPVTYAQRFGGANPHTQGTACADILPDSQSMMKEILFHNFRR